MKKKKFNYSIIYVIFFIIGIIIIFTLIPKHNQIENNLPTLTLANYKDYFHYEGKMLNENLLDNNYVSILYEDNQERKSYLIDLEKKKEINIQDILKDNTYDSFNEKINELQALKYPSAICKILNESSKAYFFNNEELIIYYNLPKDILTTKSFSLVVNYLEIKDYLNFTPIFNDNYINENGRKYDPNKISIALTFDDGPNDDKTIQLVDALESYNMSATFFMVGNKLASQADVVKKVNDSHSEVGYHSYAHTRFTSQSIATIQHEFAQSDETFYNITGNHLRLTRPPYGSYNKAVLSAIDNAFIRWNIDTNDWQYKDVDYIVNYVLENMKDRSIILFHDSYDTSVEAAIKLMSILYFQDVQVLSVSEMANLTNTPLENHLVYYSFN